VAAAAAVVMGLAVRVAAVTVVQTVVQTLAAAAAEVCRQETAVQVEQVL
jgi:hypothetical protein